MRGKILRYNADGTVPADNPFGSSNPVWAIGLRNPFGLAFSPDGKLFVTDNGPSGDDGSPPTGYDRVLQVVRGGNSQWPVCYGNSIPLHASNCPGTPPTYQSGTTTLVPTGASFVSGKGPAGYQGDFVFCSYAQDRLKVMSPDGRQLLSGSTDTTALVWDVGALRPPAADRRERLAEPPIRDWRLPMLYLALLAALIAWISAVAHAGAAVGLDLDRRSAWLLLAGLASAACLRRFRRSPSAGASTTSARARW